MTWVLVYLGIALAGLVMVSCFALWLWRRTAALLRELGVLMDRADQLMDLLGQIGQPTDVLGSQVVASSGVTEGVEKDDPAAGDLGLRLTRSQAT